jgi:hypothetical protein
VNPHLFHALLAAVVLALPSAIAFKKGDVSLHKRSVTLTGRSLDGKSDVRFVFKPTEQAEIRDVNARGEATIVTSCVSMEIVQDGRTEKLENAQFPPTTRVFSKSGLVLREIDGTENALEPLLVVEGLIANTPMPPESGEAPGSWRTDMLNRLTPGQRVTMVSRTIGAETVFGIKTVMMAFTLEVPTTPAQLPNETISAKGERWIDISTGRIVKSDIELDNVAFPFRGSMIIGKVHILDEIIVPGVNEKTTGAPAPVQR